MPGYTLLAVTLCLHSPSPSRLSPSDGAAAQEDSCRPLVQQQATRLGLDMFTTLAARCGALLRQQGGGGGGERPLGTELQLLLAGVKAWTDWMLCHDPLWNPLPSKPELGYAPMTLAPRGGSNSATVSGRIENFSVYPSLFLTFLQLFFTVISWNGSS